MKSNKSTLIGVIAGIIAGIIFGATAILSKMAFDLGVDSMLLIVLRNLLALPFFYVAAKKYGVSLKLEKKVFWQLTLLTVLFFAPTNIVAFYAYDLIPVGQVTVIHFLYPGVILLIEKLCFHQKIGRGKLIAAAFCIAGVLCFTPEGGFTFGSGATIGYLLALSSAFLYAAYVIGTAHSDVPKLSIFPTAFYLNLFGSIQPLFFSWYGGGLSLDFPLKAWIYIILIAISVSVIGFACLQVCIKNCGSVTAAVVFTLEPISALVLGILVLNEPYTYASIIGCGLIVTSVVLIAINSAREDKSSAEAL